MDPGNRQVAVGEQHQIASDLLNRCRDGASLAAVFRVGDEGDAAGPGFPDAVTDDLDGIVPRAIVGKNEMVIGVLVGEGMNGFKGAMDQPGFVKDWENDVNTCCNSSFSAVRGCVRWAAFVGGG